MRLDMLVAAAELESAGVEVLGAVGDLGSADIATMTLDSRQAGAGSLFCCVAGQSFDGHDFAETAVDAGAVALVCERQLSIRVPQVWVSSVRRAIGPLADALNGHPSRHMSVVGITGTNGKTTTAHLLASVFQAAGHRTATLGTLSGVRTTPEAPVLQRTLAELRDGGVSAIAMEVSSHALSQHRVDAVHFAAATFMNLTQDHLDFHLTMDRYFAAKASLFDDGRAEIAVINEDDPWGQRLIDRLERAGRSVVPFSLRNVEDVSLCSAGTRFRWDGLEIGLRLPGRFNIVNALAAATTARALDISDRAIVDGLATVRAVRGRFELLEAGQPFRVVVDYAHTPAALEEALKSTRELASRRLIVVFGCGGDRDQAKRPLMGKVATRLADLVVLTSDNPRSEDPTRIIDDVRAGVAGPGELVVEPDRARAIATALTLARSDDAVLIAGKGHESGQEIGGRTVPFDDREVARSVLARRGDEGDEGAEGDQQDRPRKEAGCSPC